MATETQEHQDARIRQEQSTMETLKKMQMSKDEIADYTPADEAKDDKYVSISLEAMRGDPGMVTVGSLTLMLKPLKRREIRTEFDPLVLQWPLVIQFAAAVRSPRVPGVDTEGVAAMMTLQRTARHRIEESEAEELSRKEQVTFVPTPAPPPITEFDVADLLIELVDALDAYDPIVAQTVHLFTRSTMPLTVEQLQESIADLEIADYATLLRQLKACLGGFTGCYADRMF